MALMLAFAPVTHVNMNIVQAAEIVSDIEHDDTLDDIIEEVDSSIEMLDALDTSDMVNADDVAEQIEKGEVQTGDEYSLRRIILFADDVTDTYGATDIIHYGDYDHYVFAFDSEEDTELAYTEMVEDYGEEKCILDEVVSADDVLADAGDVEPYDTLSWGGSYMGLDYLKAETDYYGITTAVKVGIVDSGVNASCDVFDGRIDSSLSYNFYANNQDYSDNMGHGSHVAGIVADCTPSNVKLCILRCFESGYSTNSGIIAAVEYAVENDIDIINMSLCWYNSAADKLTYINQAIAGANNKNLVICVAAGNSHGGGGIMDVEGSTYPANKSDVIVVSALDKMGGADDVVSPDTVKFADSYSYYGKTVDFAAPGTAIKSAWYDGSEKSDTGTSMATPHVSAAAAYIKMLEPGISNDALMNRLISYSVDLGDEGRDNYYGYGCPYMRNYYRDYFAAEHIPDCRLTSVVNMQNGLKVTWQKVSGADGYKVYRKGVTGGYSCIANIPSGKTTTYTDSRAQKGSKYRYVVEAVKNGKRGTYVNSIVTVRLGQPVVKVKNGKRGAIVKWEKTKGAGSYVIYRKMRGESSWKVCKKVNSNLTTWTDSNVKGGRIYMYTVKAVYNGIYSSSDPAGSRIYRMSTRAMKSVTANSRGTVTAEWKTVTGVSGYQIQYGSSSAFSPYKIKTVQGCRTGACRITGLASGSYTYIRVRSYKNIGTKIYYSGWSPYKKARVR